MFYDFLKRNELSSTYNDKQFDIVPSYHIYVVISRASSRYHHLWDSLGYNNAISSTV